MQETRVTSALPSVTLARGGAANINHNTEDIGVLANLQHEPTEELRDTTMVTTRGGRPRGCPPGLHKRM